MLCCITQFNINYAENQLSIQSKDLIKRMEADEEIEGRLPDYEIVAISDNKGDIEDNSERDAEVDIDNTNKQDKSVSCVSGLPDENEEQAKETDLVELLL
jgi:hypothetical protein